MTYKVIQKLYKEEFGRTIKSCWIADVKRQLGLTTRKSYNRLSEDEVKYPCPNGEIKKWLTEVLKKNS